MQDYAHITDPGDREGIYAEASQVESGENATHCTPLLWNLSTPKGRGRLTPYKRT